MPNGIQREILPIPDRRQIGLTTYDPTGPRARARSMASSALGHGVDDRRGEVGPPHPGGVNAWRNHPMGVRTAHPGGGDLCSG
jgi:hypothetical protein